jgi:hypothetical protein
MVKNLLKITKENVTRRNVILALTNKSTDDQMHEGINAQRNKSIKKQSHQPFNKNCSNRLAQYTVYVHKLIAHWAG